MKMFLTRVASGFALLCCLGLLQVVLTPPLVHADGGAPNLANGYQNGPGTLYGSPSWAAVTAGF